jgi:DNA mismatch repair protein MutL
MPDRRGIIILPEDLANKIAAGEVVERPASVVRELVENALDAAASKITVEVEGAGRKLIRVSDDGLGMSPEDARLAFERHATSKLTDEQGLFNITTMGFRGEALPSIASVSRVRLRTAQRGASHGVELEVTGGNTSDTVPAATLGTTLEVRDLFYNTPARRKFLKRDATELMHVVDVITKLAIGSYEKGFELSVDSSQALLAPPASGLRERVMQLYGGEFLDGLLEFSRTEGSMRVSGLVSRASMLRESRMHQYIFINRRPVRDASVAHAVSSVFHGIAPEGRYPIFFVMLELDPKEVDFNVHPAKREVRFSDKEGVYRLVRRAVSDVVRTLPDASEAFAHTFAGPQTAATFDISATDVPAGQAQEALGLWQRARFMYLGGPFVAYAESNGGVVLLDHHAAHERVLYEKLLDGRQSKGMMLLFPKQVRLSKKEHIAALDNAEMLREFGIELEDFGPETVLVRSLPEGMDISRIGHELSSVVSDAVSTAMEGGRPGRSVREAVAARIACHASVRGAKVLGQDELAAPIGALERRADP